MTGGCSEAIAQVETLQPRFVIARSAATKQSIDQRALGPTWIAASGSRPPRNDEVYSETIAQVETLQPRFVVASSAATKQSIDQRALGLTGIAASGSRPPRNDERNFRD
jgi:hypothetical protein